jgi:murein DD-endopeptidase MepM/ murein hydrolase activator NlpD
MNDLGSNNMIGHHKILPPDSKVVGRRRLPGKEGTVTTASAKPSAPAWIRTLALSGILAGSLLFPIFQSAQADGSITTDVADTASSGLSITVDTEDQLTGLTAIVVSGEENANLRAAPSEESESLATVADGEVIDLRVDQFDTILDANGIRWWPVSDDGINGWMSGDLLTQATTADGVIVSSSLVPFDFTEQATAHSTARVFGNGQNVNVRAEPSGASPILTKAADGEVVSLRIDLVDAAYDDQGARWWPVTVNGIEGWILGLHLTGSDGAPTSSPDSAAVAVATDPPAPESTLAPVDVAFSGFDAGDFVQVFTGDGSSANVRESGSPTAAIVGQLDDGEVVRVVSGPVSMDSSAAGWYQVTNNNATGFVDGDLLIASVEAVATTAAEPTEPPRSEMEEATIAAAAQATEPPTQEATEEPTVAPAVTAEPVPTLAPVVTAEPDPPEAVGTGFIYPLENYRRTQAFGCSNLGFYTFNAEFGCPLHDGLDLAAPSGTPLLASAGGTVVTAGWCNCGLGYYVEIDHGDGIHTLYGHMASQPFVSAGQTVNQGDVIGPLGSTGISTGPHVHFMVTVNGEPRNPDNYLP